MEPRQNTRRGERSSTTSSPKRPNSQEESKSSKKQKNSGNFEGISKNKYAELIRLLDDVKGSEFQKVELLGQLMELVTKVPSFPKLSWDEFRAIINNTSKMELPVQQPSSLEEFTQMVNDPGSGNPVSSPYLLPSSTIGNIMGRAHDVVVALRPNVNEATKVVIFDSIFMPIIRLFNGAVRTLPESPVAKEDRPFQPKGFADHKMFSLDGITVVFVELKNHLTDVEGLTQLLAEMLVAHQENTKNDIHLDVNGLLTDGVRYFFIRLDAKANRFRVEANVKAEFNNGRFDDNIIVIINKIFSILLISVHDALGYIKTVSEERIRVGSSAPHQKMNSADFINFHSEDTNKLKEYKQSEGGLSTRESFKHWLKAHQNLEKVKQALGRIPASQEFDKESIKALDLLYATFDLLRTKNLIGGASIETQKEFITGAVEQSCSFYKAASAMTKLNTSPKDETLDMSVFGMKTLEEIGGNVEITSWCKSRNVAEETTNWLTSIAGCTNTFLLSQMCLCTHTPVRSIPLGHLLEIRRATGIRVQKPVFNPDECGFPHKSIEELLGNHHSVEWCLKMLREADVHNAQVLEYLSEEHVVDIGWQVALVSFLWQRLKEEKMC